MQELHNLVCRKLHLESNGDRDAIAELRFRGASIDDLCLDFTLPGYPEYVLKPGDENVRTRTLCFFYFLVALVNLYFLLFLKCLIHKTIEIPG